MFFNSYILIEYRYVLCCILWLLLLFVVFYCLASHLVDFLCKTTQVLAIRYYHEKSREIRGTGWKPLKRWGYDHELIRWSPYYQAMGTAIVIGTTQTWGISVVAWKLVHAYFSDDFECDMTIERWGNVFSLKILALLLSLVVTFFIQTLLNGIRHNGLYEITDTLQLADVERIDNVAVFFIQFGKLVNYYVCAMAILGSYFIIFIANQGEEQIDGSVDYSASGLKQKDMFLFQFSTECCL